MKSYRVHWDMVREITDGSEGDVVDAEQAEANIAERDEIIKTLEAEIAELKSWIHQHTAQEALQGGSHGPE